MYYIVHRGYGTDNKLVSLIMALLKPFQETAWVEFDILYHKDRWMIVHDVDSINNFTDSLESFIEILPSINSNANYILLVDIKWDAIHNAEDSFKGAFSKLIRMTMSYKQNIYYQFNHWSHLQYAKGYNITCGLVLHQPIPYYPEEVFEFLTLNIHSFQKEDLSKIVKAYPNVFFIGYTLKNICSMSSFYPYFHAIVVDV